jgi:hypothetical protein
MDKNHHAKSLKTLADNQRWLDEHTKQTMHPGDLPMDTDLGHSNLGHSKEIGDQQQ